MKKLIITIILTVLLFGYKSNSQNILDFFRTLPEDAFLFPSIEERQSIADFYDKNKNIEYSSDILIENDLKAWFEIIDIPNGYLRLLGFFEGHIEVCYWKTGHGNQLIAIYNEACGPDCYVMDFSFWLFDGTEYVQLETSNIVPYIYEDFFIGNIDKAIEEMDKNDINYNLLFVLPQNGKNIIALFGDTHDAEKYKKHLKGNKMELIWNDGKFKKGKISWKN